MGTLTAFASASKRGLLATYSANSFSLLANNFNRLYCAALNLRSAGMTHFAMLHDDILPEHFWLDKLMDQMNETRADVLSVVSPIKTKQGLTSTALDTDKYRPRRLTLKEIHKDYPETFTSDDLLLNTGCMLIDIRRPFADKVWFTIDDEIVCTEGRFEPLVVPEDWNFSRMAKAHGAKLFATRSVKIRHQGFNDFPNSSWGTAETDLGDDK